MSEITTTISTLCPNCAAADNEPDSKFCMTCGSKLGSSLIMPPAPPPLRTLPSQIGKVSLNALLWSAPTYIAYSAASTNGSGISYIVVEQSSALGDPFARFAGLGGASSDPSKPGSRDVGFTEVAAALERFGMLKPTERVLDGGSICLVFEHAHAQPLAHLDQMKEKEARSIGLQLCAIAERFHKLNWTHNGFEPYTILLDNNNKVRLLGFDRARPTGTPVSKSPIFPSRGYTAPELFELGGAYDQRADVYSIGALLQSLLTGERIESGEGTCIYPIATIFPQFERILTKALAEDPADRFQTVSELKTALADLSLPVVLQSGHFTDVGLIRELNEDSVLALNLTQYFESVQTQIGLYVVSDGMGGEAAGEIASRVTVRAIAEWVTEKLISASLKSTHNERIVAPTHTGGLRLTVADGNDMATTEMLKAAVMNANQEVLAYSNSHPAERGLGATVTVAMIVGDVLTVANVGDSRCYLLSGDSLEQLTEDHSLVQKMINTGNLSRSEAKVHPYRNVIYRSIGGDEQIEIDIIRRKLSSGDILLLCSDGLTGMLSDDQIRDILMVNPDPNIAAKELVVNANANGGEDNTSVIVVTIS
ncbi:MAG TPA: Stp1/IreP family PP2C-type Ser/Thr phosphatase [Blastocatellia bacterium]|nr:Stp1/IreP family PP2C-type Ser/Thr phosphatase [Blastocatellia bacterium]